MNVTLALFIASIPIAVSAIDASHAAQSQNEKRDKTGTIPVKRNSSLPLNVQPERFATMNFFQAEGTGLEPATPCGAPHFQCTSNCHKSQGKQAIRSSAQRHAQQSMQKIPK